jgi:phosphatidylglycerol---prolipoprotein diacylglyceryl transferase
MIFFAKRYGFFSLSEDYPMRLSALFLIGYSVARLISEQFRLPDGHIGYLFETGWITMGMLYTLPMLLA